MQELIRYGQIINIQLNGEFNGYLSAVGNASKDIYFQNIETNEQQTHSIPNIEETLFKITPKLKFQAQKQYKQHLKQISDSSLKINTQMNQSIMMDSMMDISQGFLGQQSQQNVLNELKKKVQEEIKSNQLLIEQSINDPVCYGQEVQFYHIQSQMYITGSKKIGIKDPNSYQMHMSDQLDAGMVFQFIPRYKLRQMGQFISYDEKLIIMNCKQKCFIEFDPFDICQFDLKLSSIEQSKTLKYNSSDVNIDFQELNIQIPEDQQKFNYQDEKDLCIDCSQENLDELPVAKVQFKSGCKITRFISSLKDEQKSDWKILQYSSTGSLSKDVRFGDLIQLIHCETNSLINIYQKVI